MADAADVKMFREFTLYLKVCIHIHVHDASMLHVYTCTCTCKITVSIHACIHIVNKNNAKII